LPFKAISVDDLFREMPVPADLAFVWQRMDLNPEEN
jgi:hypothetical protein